MRFWGRQISRFGLLIRAVLAVSGVSDRLAFVCCRVRDHRAGVLTAAVMLYLAAVAGADEPLPIDHRFVHEPENRFLQQLPVLAMQTVIAAWVFVLGSCFGSFLNVVIYRLPAGLALGKPKSRCPKCETPLAARDNIPVLGWLLLRGRCRYCQLPIASRYPLVEATCGAVFLILMFGELLTGAANLPLRHPDHFHINPGLWLVWFVKWDLCGIYLFHCCLMITVLAVVMIGYDGHRPQRGLTIFGLGTALIAGAMWPALRPIPAALWPEGMLRLNAGFWWQDSVLSPGSRYWTGVTLCGFLDGICGTVVGAIAGRLPAWQAGHARPATAAITTAMTITGAFLGWQATGMLLLICQLPLTLLLFIVRAKESQELWLRRFAVSYCGLLLVFLLTWEKLDSAPWMIGHMGWKWTSADWRLDWIGTFVASAALASLFRCFLKPHDSPCEPDNSEVVLP
ncbi:MAG: prepilin peptidase [Planctomycetaceae bacterium]